jgi:hypothetical protein
MYNIYIKHRTALGFNNNHLGGAYICPSTNMYKCVVVLMCEFEMCFFGYPNSPSE